MKKILSFFRNNYKYFIFLIILSVISWLFLVDKFVNTKSVIFFISSMILLTILTIFLCKKNMKLEKIFLMIVIPIGLMYMILMPVGKVPDEMPHFLRAYEISKGHILSKQDKDSNGYGMFTDDIYEYMDGDYSYSDTLGDLNQKTFEGKVKYIYTNTSLYAFICYLPQAIGVFIANIFKLSILWQAYFARLFNFALWVVMTYFSFKFIPYKKLSMLFILLLPITLQEAISISPDALTIATSVLFISYILHLANDSDKKMNRKQEIFITILSILMSLCKIVYLPLCLLVMILPKDKFKTKKEKWLKTILLLIIVSVVSFGWLFIASRYLVEFQPGVDSSNQVKYVLLNPLNYIIVVFRTINSEFFNYIFNIMGGSLGAFDIQLSSVYVLLTMIIMSIVFLIDKNSDSNKKIYKSHKYIYIFIFLATCILIFTSLYVQWTAYKSPVVTGVQGRYFLPILMLLPLILEKVNVKVDLDNKYIYIVLMIYNMYALNIIFNTFI